MVWLLEVKTMWHTPYHVFTNVNQLYILYYVYLLIFRSDLWHTMKNVSYHLRVVQNVKNSD
jgi:hypothetical protein